MQLAGVVGVGVEGGDREGDVRDLAPGALTRMRSQLSEEEICSGMRVSGVWPSLRTVSRARTAMCCSAGRRWTSMSKAVKVTAWRRRLSADGFADRLDGGCAAAGLGLGGGLAVFVGGAGEDDFAAGRFGWPAWAGWGARVPGPAGCSWRSAREAAARPMRPEPGDCRRRENFMSPGLSVFLV